MGVTGFRITARALDSHFVSEQILEEYRGLEECAERVGEIEVEEAGARKVVFVLEEEPGAAREVGAHHGQRQR
jgi:hypothetical protein